MQATIYIRKENEKVWTKLGEHKSRFVNEALSNPGAMKAIINKNRGEATEMKAITEELGVTEENVIREIALADTEGKGYQPPAIRKIENGTCKIHGIPLTTQGKCLQKGCKYA